MRLPILVLAHIVTAHRVDLDLSGTKGEGSDTSSIAATALQDSTAVVGTHGSDSGVLSQADLGIPGKRMQRLALILAASSVLGGPQWAVEAKDVPTAFVAPGVRRNALSGCRARCGADLNAHLKGLDEVAKASAAAVAIASTIGVSPALAGDVGEGQKVFDANCAACHAGGQNVIVAEKTLEKAALDQYLAGGRSEASIIMQATNGKNAMPAFGDRLSEDEIKNVASYVIATSEKGWDDDE